jgi:hypothetical protein
MVLEFLNTSRSVERLANLIVGVRDVHEAWKISFAVGGSGK